MISTNYIFYGFMGTSTTVMRLEFRSFQGDYQIRSASVNDANSWTSTAWVTLGDQMRFVGFDRPAVSAAGADNGGLTLWVDGQRTANLSVVDNDTCRVDRIRLDAVSGIDVGTRGTYYFDAFESGRQTYSGL